ncbi:MAG: tetratricopeptide repeat-containing sulfotransferase family protein [Rhodanobacteraceae bacterium]
MAVPRLQGLTMAAAQQVMATAQAIETGGPELAAERLAPLLASHPDHPEVLRLYAGIQNLRGDYTGAIIAMKRAISGRPQDPLYYNTLGAILGQAGEFDTAIDALRHACQLQPDLAIAWFNLGVILTRCMRHAEATEVLQRSVALDPQYMPARALLGDMLRAENRIDEAAMEYRRVIADQPWTGMAWWGLADLKTIRFASSDIENIRRAMRDDRAHDNDMIAMGLALAKALEDEGRYAESMATLAQAHALARCRRAWSAQAFSDGISMILDAFTPPPAPSPKAELGRGVIFITSLPRSGSTLVEQILASHSMVEGPGELPDLPMVLTEESHRRDKPYPTWVKEMQPEGWQRLGERYLQRTAHWCVRRPMFTDKLPANWYYIGAIRAMLPAAKIICCRRDPLETCFSCYRQHLDNNEYARTFNDLAAYWGDFDRSVRHWRALHPSHVHEHVYERLIDEPEASIRALLTFCGLPFEEGCLHPHESKRDVRTPSAMQVRQPLQAGTARAQRYGALLDPLRSALGLPPFDKCGRALV